LADVNQLPGVAEQLRLIAGLRWNLLKNNMRRKSNRWDLVGMIFAGVGSAAVVIGVSFGFCAGTYAFLTTNRVAWMKLPFWLIFIWWQVIPIFVAGFGASFDFRNLLRFPVSLRTFYILGLGYGFADFAATAAMCWIACILATVAVARAQLLPVMLLICTLFVLVNVTLERLTGSWLERILANRRAREVFLGIFVLCMVSLNFLNPAFQRWGDSGAKPGILLVIPYFSWFPSSLAGNALTSSVQGNFLGTLLAFVGLLGWVAATSGLLWQRYRKQYLGEELSESAAPSAAKRVARKEIASESGPSLLPAPVGGVVRKEFRYLTRNGFSFITLIFPPVMVIIFSMQFAAGSSQLKGHGHGLSPQTFFPAVMGYLILILLSPAYNSFAFEGRGIQSYFMAPVRMRDVLVGKNLFLVGVVGLELALCLAVLTWRLGFPGLPMFLSTIAVAAFGVTGQLAIANWSALSFPKKMEIGKMKGQRNSGVAVWTAFGVQILLGGIATIVLLAGRWLGNPWLPVVVFTGLTAAALGGYFASLDPLSELAERKKELLIETLCR
jgi:ABC-2 type transport system permease protein